MNVISYKQIRSFIEEHADSKASLNAWFKIAKRASWRNLVELKATYPTADLVGRYTVFNIKGNNYRLIARIVYRSQTLFIVKLLTHEEYDLGRWKK